MVVVWTWAAEGGMSKMSWATPRASAEPAAVLEEQRPQICGVTAGAARPWVCPDQSSKKIVLPHSFIFISTFFQANFLLIKHANIYMFLNILLRSSFCCSLLKRNVFLKVRYVQCIIVKSGALKCRMNLVLWHFIGCLQGMQLVSSYADKSEPATLIVF